VLAAASLALALATPVGQAGSNVRLPAAGTLRQWKTIGRVAPDPKARAVFMLHEFRPDFRRQVVLVVAQRVGADGRIWYRLSPPMRPNGTAGWIPAAAAEVHPVTARIVVERGRRRISVYRNGKRIVVGAVAVGAPGMETPLGSFYVTARFVPTDPFLGAYAFETSAYSKLSEWPGGGVVGIHGTSAPWLLGKAVSHGCIRVSNETASRMWRVVPVGTPVQIVR